VVFLDQWAATARSRKNRLDEQAGEEYASDALLFAGTPSELADLVEDWAAAGISGHRLRPASMPYDLEAITRGLVPELQRRQVYRSAYPATTLRAALGLHRPANRYATI
jgi:alkanesulfonate monooxygenase SsuD/methylene tetrahydromethanopterin reductase-like flavin-dependent oxidoreductase (luciferase family)